MKKTIMILAALAFVLCLPQCKKQTSGVIEGDVEITLDVSAVKGSRIHVDPNSGDVAFEQNDVVYVASDGKFVGTLTCRGTRFTGKIANATLNQPLYFFFLGNKTPAETLTAGTSTSCSVVISDQTSKLPVISFATSNENFRGEGNYTAFFLNRAALVKFDVTTPSLATTSILGMYNKVSVNFADNSFAYSQDDQGAITLPAGSGERWAILLPQAQKTNANVKSNDGLSNGTIATIPAIDANDYLTEGIEAMLSDADAYVDLGLPSGTLWATFNVGATTPEGYGDYFAWGETTPKSTYTWGNYQHGNGFDHHLTKYNTSAPEGTVDNLTVLEPSDDAATVNWGSNWRMPTEAEFVELMSNTTRTSEGNGFRFTASNNKSIFLPAMGYFSNVGDNGCYWSSSLYVTETTKAYSFFFNVDTEHMTTDFTREYGLSVRAVRASH